MDRRSHWGGQEWLWLARLARNSQMLHSGLAAGIGPYRRLRRFCHGAWLLIDSIINRFIGANLSNFWLRLQHFAALFRVLPPEAALCQTRRQVPPWLGQKGFSPGMVHLLALPPSA